VSLAAKLSRFAGAEPMQILHWLPLVLWVAVTVRVTITIRRRK